MLANFTDCLLVCHTTCPETITELICFPSQRCKKYVTAPEITSHKGTSRQKLRYRNHSSPLLDLCSRKVIPRQFLWCNLYIVVPKMINCPKKRHFNVIVVGTDGSSQDAVAESSFVHPAVVSAGRGRGPYKKCAHATRAWRWKRNNAANARRKHRATWKKSRCPIASPHLSSPRLSLSLSLFSLPLYPLRFQNRKDMMSLRSADTSSYGNIAPTTNWTLQKVAWS